MRAPHPGGSSENRLRGGSENRLRGGRGRLSSLDLLPESAEEDVVWAQSELRARKKTQADILDSLNIRLRAKGLEPLSASSFNRAAMRLNRMASRLEEARDIAGVLANKFEDGSDENLTLLVAETIKMIVYETLEKIDDPRADSKSAEMLGNLSIALGNAEKAKKMSADLKSRIEAQFAARAAKAVDAAAKARGLSAEMRDAIKTDILGLRSGS